MTTFEHWREWKQLCAIDHCAAETRSALTVFAYQRWTGYLKALGGEAEHRELSARDIWHRLETWCVTVSTKNGNAYKDWLFARLDTHMGPPLEIVESGAALLTRDAVRDYLRHEGRGRRPGSRTPEPSLDATVPGTDPKLTYGDMLPGEFDLETQVALREYQRLGGPEAEALYVELSDSERIVLAARSLDLPLSNPTVERLAGRKKSVLCSLYGDIEKKILRRVDARYPNEDENGRRVLAAVALMRLMALSQESKNSSETWRAELFELAEDLGR